jgi:hypothetical protein
MFRYTFVCVSIGLAIGGVSSMPRLIGYLLAVKARA